jgi:hypothetical protein
MRRGVRNVPKSGFKSQGTEDREFPVPGTVQLRGVVHGDAIFLRGVHVQPRGDLPFPAGAVVEVACEDADLGKAVGEVLEYGANGVAEFVVFSVSSFVQDDVTIADDAAAGEYGRPVLPVRF